MSKKEEQKEKEPAKKEQVGVINIGRPEGNNGINPYPYIEDALCRGLIFELIVDEAMRGHVRLFKPLNDAAKEEAEAQFFSMS